MSIFKLAEEYISKHSRNIGTDVVQHLKAFAAHAESTLKAEAEVVQAHVSEVPSDIQHAETAVESALEEVKEHAEHAFADLLAAQSVKTETPTES